MRRTATNQEADDHSSLGHEGHETPGQDGERGGRLSRCRLGFQECWSWYHASHSFLIRCFCGRNPALGLHVPVSPRSSRVPPGRKAEQHPDQQRLQGQAVRFQPGPPGLQPLRSTAVRMDRLRSHQMVRRSLRARRRRLSPSRMLRAEVAPPPALLP